MVGIWHKCTVPHARTEDVHFRCRSNTTDIFSISANSVLTRYKDILWHDQSVLPCSPSTLPFTRGRSFTTRIELKKIERKRIVDEKNFGRIGSCQTFPSPFVRDFFAVLESTGISFRRRHRFSLIRPVRIRVTDNGRVVGNRQDPRDPASRKTVSRTDDRNGEERPARESAHTADWKLMRMRERTRSNCGRRYPSTLVAKVEGGETTQGLGTTRHWWRLWLLAHGYSVCARMCRDQRRRLLSSPRFGTSLADLPLFKIGKVVERGCPSPCLSIPLSMISMILMEIGGTLNDHAPSAWRLCPGLLYNLQVYFLFLTYNSLDKFFFVD